MNIHGIEFSGDMHMISAYDEFVWVEEHGKAIVNGQEFQGSLILFAAKEPPTKSGDSTNSVGPKHKFSFDKGLHKHPTGDWNFTMLTLATPYGNLKIESPKGEAEVVCS